MGVRYYRLPSLCCIGDYRLPVFPDSFRLVHSIADSAWGCPLATGNVRQSSTKIYLGLCVIVICAAAAADDDDGNDNAVD